MGEIVATWGTYWLLSGLPAGVPRLGNGVPDMSSRIARFIVLCGILVTGVGVYAHHAVAGVYDLNKEMVLQGRLKKLNFTNPHVSIELTVPNPDGTNTDWLLTTASIQNLTRQGINKTSMKPGEILKVTILPAKNGNPAGFIRSIELGDKEFKISVD